MIHYRFHDIQPVIDFQNNFEILDSEEVSDEEVWESARHSENIPDFENVLTTLVYQKIQYKLEEHFSKYADKFEYDANFAASSIRFDGEEVGDPSELLSALAIHILKNSIDRNPDFETLVNSISNNEDSFDIEDGLYLTELDFSKGQEYWEIKISNMYKKHLTDSMKDVVLYSAISSKADLVSINFNDKFLKFKSDDKEFLLQNTEDMYAMCNDIGVQIESSMELDR